MPRRREGPQVARCPEALGGNDLIHLLQIKIPPADSSQVSNGDDLQLLFP